MSVQYLPKIISNGLVVYFDISDPKSYPGFGNQIYNLCPTRIGEIQLFNANYNNVDKSIVLNTNQSYILMNTIWNFSSFTEITIEILFKSTVAGNSNSGYLVFDSDNNTYPFWLGKTSSNTWQFFWNYGPGLSKGASISSSSYAANSWIHIAIRGYLSNSTTLSETSNFFELIVNGNNYSNSHSNNNTSSLNYPTTINYFGRRAASFGNGDPPGSPVSDYAPISIGSYKLYNRVLSRSEILANYNSTKLKYNI
jgi:hypothetical protein